MRFFWQKCGVCKYKHLSNRELLEKIMSGVDDLNTAVATLTQAVTDNTTAVNNEITVVNQVIAALQAGGITDAQAEALAQSLQGSVTSVQAASQALNDEVTNIQPPTKS